LRLVLDGSFVADVYEPNDIDCILLIGPAYPADANADAEFQQGLPFVHMEMGTQEVFDYFVNHFFGTDRRNAPKGMIEIQL
jgi:hypothetical protein